MCDPYFYENVPVLRTKLNIYDPKCRKRNGKYSVESILQTKYVYATIAFEKDNNTQMMQKERVPGCTAYTTGGSFSFSEKPTVWVRLPTIHLHLTTCICSIQLH